MLPATSSREVLLGCLDVEADELWSFVREKANPHWVWIAMDKRTRQIIAFHVGDRSQESTRLLWAKIPAVYREQATFYTDQYAAYAGLTAGAQHAGLLQKGGESYRSYPLFHLSLQSHKSSITCIILRP